MTRFWAAVIVCLAICSVSLAVSLYCVSSDLDAANADLSETKRDMEALSCDLVRLRSDIERLTSAVDVYSRGVENAGKERTETIDKIANDPYTVDWLDRLLPPGVRDALARPSRCNDPAIGDHGALPSDAIGANGDTQRSTSQAH